MLCILCTLCIVYILLTCLFKSIAFEKTVKETHDKKNYLDGHCAKCKLLRLKMSYTASKLEDINKFECHQQIKALRKKERGDTNDDDFFDNI